MGLELPSQSLGYTHGVLVAVLAALALWRPSTRTRLAVLGATFLVTLGAPVLWVGPVWTEPPELRHFAGTFFLAFASSLAIPFAFGTIAVTALARRPAAPSIVARLSWTLLSYFLGVLASLPVSFNYALAYPLIR